MKKFVIICLFISSVSALASNLSSEVEGSYKRISNQGSYSQYSDEESQTYGLERYCPEKVEVNIDNKGAFLGKRVERWSKLPQNANSDEYEAGRIIWYEVENPEETIFDGTGKAPLVKEVRSTEFDTNSIIHKERGYLHVAFIWIPVGSSQRVYQFDFNQKTLSISRDDDGDFTCLYQK